jgi:hypothetical protein
LSILFDKITLKIKKASRYNIFAKIFCYVNLPSRSKERRLHMDC